MTNDGTITIQLDGKNVLSANYQTLVSGGLGAPWVWPMVGNLYDTSGGAEIKVPDALQEVDARHGPGQSRLLSCQLPPV